MTEPNNARFLLNACPRCVGTLHLDEDMFGARMVCYQCGQDYELVSGRYAPYQPIRDMSPGPDQTTRGGPDAPATG